MSDPIVISDQSVELEVTSGPVLEYDEQAFEKLVTEVPANEFVVLSVTNTTSGPVGYALKHDTGPGSDIHLQPVGTWSLGLSTGSPISQAIEGSSASDSKQQLQLDANGNLQWLDSHGRWQPLPTSTPLVAATFKIANKTSSTTLAVAGATTIASQATAQVGVAAPNAGSKKTLAMDVATPGLAEDPTFVIKAKGGGTRE